MSPLGAYPCALCTGGWSGWYFVGVGWACSAVDRGRSGPGTSAGRWLWWLVGCPALRDGVDNVDGREPALAVVGVCAGIAAVAVVASLVEFAEGFSPAATAASWMPWTIARTKAVAKAIGLTRGKSCAGVGTLAYPLA